MIRFHSQPVTSSNVTSLAVSMALTSTKACQSTPQQAHTADQQVGCVEQAAGQPGCQGPQHQQAEYAFEGFAAILG